MESGEHAKDYRESPKYGGFHDPAGRLHFRDLPCPMVNVNCAHKTLPLIQIFGGCFQTKAQQANKPALTLLLR